MLGLPVIHCRYLSLFTQQPQHMGIWDEGLWSHGVSFQLVDGTSLPSPPFSLCQRKCKSDVSGDPTAVGLALLSEDVLLVITFVFLSDNIRWFSLDDSNHVWCVQSLHVISSIET